MFAIRDYSEEGTRFYKFLLCARASTHRQCKNQLLILASAISQISFRVFGRDVQNIDFPNPGIILTMIRSNF